MFATTAIVLLTISWRRDPGFLTKGAEARPEAEENTTDAPTVEVNGLSLKLAW
jgi:hypothetical protein